MGAPAYEWPTKTTGPSIAFTRVAIDSASETSPRSGLGIATTVWPSLFSSRITPPNPDASANAPCTSTMVVPGTSLGSRPLPIPIRGCDTITPSDAAHLSRPFACAACLLTCVGGTARHDPVMNNTGICETDLLDHSVGPMPDDVVGGPPTQALVCLPVGSGSGLGVKRGVYGGERPGQLGPDLAGDFVG